MIIFNKERYVSEGEETVLDCLLRYKVEVPHSCRSGVCQTCLMRMVEGTPGGDSQKGLKPSLVSQNYFLPCRCKADQDMEVVLPDAANFRFTVTVLNVDSLTNQIIRLRLNRPDGFQYRPGQYVTLYNAQGIGRTYSLASVPALEPFLELHVRSVPNGRVSGWIHNDLRAGDTVAISEAIGNCFYMPDKPAQSILLIGTGSGLAPLSGIIRDALHQGHQGTIKLYHGSGTSAGIYLQAELKQLAATHSNFHYQACMSRTPVFAADIKPGRASDVALEENPQVSGWRAYICGEPSMVSGTSRALFMAGISLKEIYSDSFIHSKP